MATNKRRTIELENVNHPGQVGQADADRYEAMKGAFLKVLDLASPTTYDGNST